jgi:hypothetical protein
MSTDILVESERLLVVTVHIRVELALNMLVTTDDVELKEGGEG